jgi:hypothetical protein
MCSEMTCILFSSFITFSSSFFYVTNVSVRAALPTPTEGFFETEVTRKAAVYAPTGWSFFTRESSFTRALEAFSLIAYRAFS